MFAKFGPAGNSDSFKTMGYKSSLDVPEYLVKMGLDAFEYQCGRGVNIGAEKAVQLGKLAAQAGITLSLHAPYYISMSSLEVEKRDRSVDYILQSARAVDAMGGDRIVIHTGSCGKLPRVDALDYACDTMQKALTALDDAGLAHIHPCPEVMGKMNQLGTLEEVLALCQLDERILPCVDFGHLNARTHGALATKADFAAVLDTMENALGRERASRFHAHFSKIQYTEGGEKCHLTFADTVYGPDFEPLMELLATRDYCPTIICESAGTQAEDAATMKAYYQKECEAK